MAALYEYVISFIWGDEEERAKIDDGERDSLDDSIGAISSKFSHVSESRITIRKPTNAQLSQHFKATPSMIIKDPEPKDSYDARVFAIIFVPAGLIIGTLGAIVTTLSYTTVAGFPFKESAANAIYGHSVVLLGPVLIGIAVCCILVALLAMLCTPHGRRLPLIYPKAPDDGVGEETPHSATSRRSTVVPVTASGASGAIAGASGPIAGASGPIAGASGPIAGASGLITGASGVIAGASGLIAGISGPIAGASGPIAGASGPIAGFSGPIAGFSGPIAGASGLIAGASGLIAGASGPIAGASGLISGVSGLVSGTSGFIAGTSDVTADASGVITGASTTSADVKVVNPDSVASVVQSDHIV